LKILITGIAGTIGGLLADDLSRDHEVHGLDVRPSSRPRARVADLSDAASLPRLFEGMDAVVHLAAERRHGREIGWDILLPRNIVPTANVFDAARAAGVRRVVFASSMHVMGGYEEDEPYRSIVAGHYGALNPDRVALVRGDMPPRPDGRYAVSKLFGEDLGRYYAEWEGMEAVSVRLGTVSQDDRPGADPRSFVSYFSHRDLKGFLRACIEKPGLKSEVVYGASANTWKVYDTPYAWRVLGFRPSDDAETFRRHA
jgi:nucleoside-diphosphate-sugar epimerase